MLDTEAGNQFWQLGMGVEIGTRYIEVRGNYYLPLSEKQLAEERRSRQTYQNTRSSSSTHASQGVTPLSDPTATGNTIVQDALFTNYSTRTSRTTTTSTTIERLFRRYEEGMEGWDLEVAVLIPGLDRWMDVSLIGGYYSFDNQPFGPQQGGTGNVQGWKAGVEIRPVPALVLTGMWYEDDRLTGSDWTVGMQLQVPFEAGDLGDGKNFWSRIGDSFRPRRRHLIERVSQPVHRQNSAIKIANSVKETEKVVAQNTSTSVKRVTRVVSQSQQHLVLKEDVVFVNNDGPTGNGIGAGSAGGDGTAENPYDTIQAGANLAGANSSYGRVWNVYTQGGGANYVESVTAPGSVSFTSSAERIAGVAGTHFGTGDVPFVDGGFKAELVDFLGVKGYTIENGHLDGNGITASMVGRTEVERNTIRNVGGIGVQVILDSDVVGSALVAENEIKNSFGHGVITAAFGASFLTATVRDNTIIDAGNDGVAAETLSIANATVTIANNRIETSGQDGVGVVASSSSTLTTFIQDNDIIQPTQDGIALHADTSGFLTATLLRNGIDHAGRHGLGVDSQHDATLTFTAAGNTINHAVQHGVSLKSETTSSLTATLQSNRIEVTVLDGVRALSDGDSSLHVTGIENTIVNTGWNNVFLQSEGSSDLTAVFTDNTMVSATLDGITSAAYGTSVLNLTATGNEFHDNLASFGTFVHDSARLTATLERNVVNSTSGRALESDSNEAGVMTVTATGNTFNAFYGLYLDASGTSQTTFTFTGNSFDGAYNAFTGGPSESATVTLNATNNTILNSTSDMMYMYNDDTSVFNINFTNNRIEGVNGAAFLMESGDSATMNFTLTGNNIEGTISAAGINLESKGTSTLNAVLNGNTILNTGTEGIRVFETAPGSSLIINGTISNTINDTGMGRYTIYGGFPFGTFIL
ncbi:MAG TPA: right-handed parallel beta-helix repeat-containing protein, partial [Verrucomicrobium sp.]|nr:right-handed parallel beta-helix repeat-containing protein [Verrucomicrobium sp.]